MDAPALAFVLHGETVVWQGFAPKGLRLRPIDALLIPFSLLWGGFAIFWETAAVLSHTPLFFRLWGIPFVLAGLYLIVGRFFLDAVLRERTSYAISDRAAYVVRVGPLAAVRRYGAGALDTMTYEPRPDGTGTIRLGPPNNRALRNPWTSGSLDALDGIPDAAEVYALLVRTRATTP